MILNSSRDDPFLVSKKTHNSSRQNNALKKSEIYNVTRFLHQPQVIVLIKLNSPSIVRRVFFLALTSHFDPVCT